MLQTDVTVLFIASVPFLGGLLALAFTGYLLVKVKAADRGEGAQVEISETIQRGAKAFLTTEYVALLPFVVGMALFFLIEEAVQVSDSPGPMGWKIVICFFCGAILSATAGWFGMMIATDTNVKTAQAAKTGLNPALKIAFAGGAVMGFIVVGLGLLGVSILFFLFAEGWEQQDYPMVSYGNSSTLYKSNGCVPTSSIEAVGEINIALNALAGFSFGASAIALFARVAGGIYTKAADVGADLVGKVEQDFPEDSYYNPATIADNVGDNVGDVAGMGADLFESFVGSIIAAATLAMSSHCNEDAGYKVCEPDLRRVAMPFWIAGWGVVASLIGFFCVGTSAQDGDANLQKALLSALHRGIYSAASMIILFAIMTVFILYHGDQPDPNSIRCANTGVGYNSLGYEWKDGWLDFACIFIGLLTGILIGEGTEYFTSYSHSPTQSITKSGVTGHATVIIQGLGIGMLSAVPPVIFIVAAVISCSALSDVYGVGLAAVGMLATLAITLATDAYGPVADNAGGVAEMAHLDAKVRERTDALDALGNTTAATGKGFAVGSAVLTALAFLNAYSEKIKPNVLFDGKSPQACDTLTGGVVGSVYQGMTASQCMIIYQKEFGNFFSLADPLVLSGLLLGAMLPFLFAALTMLSVGKAATGIILEVRRQLNTIPHLKDLANASMEPGFQCPSHLKHIKPDVANCVTICTQASLKEMLLPGLIAVMTPIGIGLLIGGRCLGGLLMGSIATGFLLAVMTNNAGGAWDNAKKWVENEMPVIAGVKVEKKSEIHKAVVTGDTVGDPFKDTSGPALNILIKLMSVLSLTCAGIFRHDWGTYWQGIIWLAVEFIIAFGLFYWVWWMDDTLDSMTAAPQDEEEEACFAPSAEINSAAEDATRQCC